ncbi:hypothetical protein [Streptomyces sp. ID05-18]|uniref:hypothetical protein n=1 Tax=Streptomyces sp. ID05-18 TaxID=3028662 RepID=UPI0029B63D56|nr:hypothetical protein [Streptomyces sp. ID05-18]MDX3488464.1 hypothetical protein [Streptomyces sp. ID05-18]
MDYNDHLPSPRWTLWIWAESSIQATEDHPDPVFEVISFRDLARHVEACYDSLAADENRFAERLLSFFTHTLDESAWTSQEEGDPYLLADTRLFRSLLRSVPSSRTDTPLAYGDLPQQALDFLDGLDPTRDTVVLEVVSGW